MVEASDVIIEVLDARDPLGCRCLDVERFVRRTDPSKKIVLLLNKIGAPWWLVARGQNVLTFVLWDCYTVCVLYASRRFWLTGWTGAAACTTVG